MALLEMTLPSSFRTAMGVSEGSLVELSLENGKAVISPQVIVNREIVTGLPKNRNRLSASWPGSWPSSGRKPKKKASTRCP